MTHLIHLTIPKVADAGAPRRIRTAQLTTRETSTSAAMVSADGDIDAANANAFIDYTLANAASSSGLIVDLRHVQFIAVEGFSALHKIAVRCAGAGISWALVPGPSADRLLRLCDPDRSLPVLDHLDIALTGLLDEH